MVSKKLKIGKYLILQRGERRFEIREDIGWFVTTYEATRYSLRDAINKAKELAEKDEHMMRFKRHWITEDDYLMEQL